MKPFTLALSLMLSIFISARAYSCQHPEVLLEFPESVCYGEEITIKAIFLPGCLGASGAFVILPSSCSPVSANLIEHSTISQGTVYSIDDIFCENFEADISIIIEMTSTVLDEVISTGVTLGTTELVYKNDYPLSDLQFCTTELPPAPVSADANIVYHGYCGGHNTSNYGSATELTASFAPGSYCNTDTKINGLVKMEMPEIPAGAIIQSATLSLTPSVNTGSNDAKLSLITSNWDESSVIYDTKPYVSSTNTVAVPHKNGLATREFDILAMVEYWRQKPNQNYGVMLSLLDQSGTEKELSFYSSNSENAEYHPKLTITYSNNNSNMLGAVADAQINSSSYCNGTNTNSNDYLNELFYASYTPGQYCYSGGYTKGVMKFDFSNVDPATDIQSATLILTSVNNIGSNWSVLKKITSAWDQTTVTWNNQPTTTASDQISIFRFAAGFVELDVTSWVESWLADPSSNYGFMLELEDEVTEETRMSFYSSNSIITENQPRIVINMKSGSIVVREAPSAQTEPDESNIRVTVYPNPTRGSVSVKSNREIENIAVFNSTGKLVFKTATDGTDTSIDLSGLPEGAYNVQVSTAQETINETIMLQK